LPNVVRSAWNFDRGAVNLVVEFVTIRLEKSALADLADAIRRGLDALSRPGPTLH
jgi:hypothetical protein